MNLNNKDDDNFEIRFVVWSDCIFAVINTHKNPNINIHTHTHCASTKKM